MPSRADQILAAIESRLDASGTLQAVFRQDEDHSAAATPFALIGAMRERTQGLQANNVLEVELAVEIAAVDRKGADLSVATDAVWAALWPAEGDWDLGLAFVHQAVPGTRRVVEVGDDSALEAYAIELLVQYDHYLHDRSAGT